MDQFFGGRSQMLTALRAHLSRLPTASERFDHWIEEYRPILIERGIVAADGIMVSTKGYNGLIVDTIRQMGEDLMDVVRVLTPAQHNILNPRIQRRLANAGD